MRILDLKYDAFGLDVGDSFVKIVKLKKKSGFLQPVSCIERKIEPNIIRSGIIQDEVGFINAIKDALSNIRGEKIKTKYVIASLPEEKSFLQVIQMPIMKEEELKAAIVFEIENYIPLPVDQVYLDFQIINPIAGRLDHLDVFIIAVEKTIIDPYVSCLKKAGLVPLALEVETQSIARALVKSETSLAPLILIDFGEDITNFIVFSGHSIRFTSSIPVSFRQIIGEISNELNEPILEELVINIKKYTDFYSEHRSHEHLLENKNIEKIILSGNGANLKGIDSFLSQKLNMPVELGNPWINFSPKLKKIDLQDIQNKPLSFTAAIGLALSGDNKFFS